MMIELVGLIGAIGGFAFLAEKAFHVVHMLCDQFIGGGCGKNGNDAGKGTLA